MSVAAPASGMPAPRPTLRRCPRSAHPRGGRGGRRGPGRPARRPVRRGAAAVRWTRSSGRSSPIRPPGAVCWRTSLWVSAEAGRTAASLGAERAVAQRRVVVAPDDARTARGRRVAPRACSPHAASTATPGGHRRGRRRREVEPQLLARSSSSGTSSPGAGSGTRRAGSATTASRASSSTGRTAPRRDPALFGAPSERTRPAAGGAGRPPRRGRSAGRSPPGPATGGGRRR